MRVLRRFRSSVLALIMPSDTISGESSARWLPKSSILGRRSVKYPSRFLGLTRPGVSHLSPQRRPTPGIGTSMLLLLPRWVQPGDKSDLEKTQVCCLQCDVLGIVVPIRLGNFPHPNSNAAAPAARPPQKS